MSKIKQFVLSISILMLGVSFPLAQESGFGSIEGVITDIYSGETLIGVNVMVGETGLGDATDVDGRYSVRRIPAGTYTLSISYIGYVTIEETIVIRAGETVRFNAALTQETLEGEEVVVSAQREGQVQAINQQLRSDKIVNVVSEAKITEMPDFNAAQAIGRLPGVSTLKSSGEENKVVIRGLSPKYNSIEVEGIRLSSTGSSQIGVSSLGNTAGSLNNDRSVDLTMVSPYMIRMISVYKSLTPDMNANSIGGTVNMELREAPVGPMYSAMWQQGYTAKSNAIGNYRAVISGSNRFFNNKVGVYLLGNLESYDRDADNMNAAYNTVSNIVNPETGYVPVQVRNVTLNRHVETRNRYGANLIIDYKLPSGSLKAINMFARLRSDYTDYNQRLNYSGAGSGNIDWTVRSGDNKIDQRMHSLQFKYDLGFMTADLSAAYTTSHNLLEDSPYFTFNQTGGIATNNVGIDEKPENLSSLVSFYGDDIAVLRNASLFSSDYEEEKFTYKADFQIPFNVGNTLNGFIKFGGQFNDQTNTNDQATPYANLNQANDTGTIQGQMMQALANEFGIEPGSNGLFSASQFSSTNRDLYNKFLDNKFGEIFYTANADMLKSIMYFLRGTPEFAAQGTASNPGGFFSGPYELLANDYEYSENYYAGYLMSRIDLFGFMLIGGVRYERVETEYFAYNARDSRNPRSQVMYPTTSTSSNEFFLPMGQVKFSPTDWFDIRYAYTQTLARPDFHQISPKYSVTQGNNIYAGNPNLQPAQAKNHDVNFTFHTNKLGLLSIGGFYKTVDAFTYSANYVMNDFTNPYLKEAGLDSLERFTQPSLPTGSYTLYSYINSPYAATIKGFEVELQTNFWYLPKPFNGTVFGINYTHIISDTKYKDYDVLEDLSTRPPTFTFVDSSRTGRLIDQPNDILNTYIGYDYEGFSGRLSFIYQGNSVSYIGRFPHQDGFTKDYFRIDLSARQKLPIANGELFLDVSNLNGVNNRSAQRSIDGFTNIQNYGLTANFGIRIRS